MLPKPNQLGQFYGSTKTHTLNNIEEIILGNLNLHPIIVQSGNYMYNAAHIIIGYLKLICNDNK